MKMDKGLIILIVITLITIPIIIWLLTRKAEGDYPGECEEGEQLLKDCPGGYPIVQYECQNGEMVFTGKTCPFDNDDQGFIEVQWIDEYIHCAAWNPKSNSIGVFALRLEAWEEDLAWIHQCGNITLDALNRLTIEIISLGY